MAGFSLVLGGARSGKSAMGERLVMAHPAPWAYVATAEARDAEMRARIDRHRAGRDRRFRTIEAPLELAQTLRDVREPALVDCLTLWLTNLMEAGRALEAESEALLDALRARSQPAILVANEVGLGLVPETALGRAFRDAAGLLHQRLAGEAEAVFFMVAGLPMRLK
jgi:adenosyl cobinamide kinase/adenosyl cobinamide phosphate guanylyltransferase